MRALSLSLFLTCHLHCDRSAAGGVDWLAVLPLRSWPDQTDRQTELLPTRMKRRRARIDAMLDREYP